MKLLLCLAALAPLGPAAAATRAELKEQLTDTRQDLRQLDQKLKQGRRDLKQHARQEKDILGQLSGINRELEAARRDARVHVRNLGVVEDRLSALRARRSRAEADEEADRAALRVQLKALQRSRSRQGAALLFGSRTPAQLALRSSALRQLSLGTGRDLEGLRRRLEQLEGYRREYSQREAELKEQRSQAERAREHAQREANKRQALLKRVRNRKEQARQTVAALEKAATRLQDLLEGLQQAARREAQRQAKAGNERGVGLKKMHRESGPTTLRGRSPWPVQGRLLSRFGRQRHPVFNVPVFNRNIEIAAPFGTPIRAIAPGTVEYVGEMQDFGKLVVVDHGGGMKSVYGYASAASVEKGQAVAQGDALGEVGEHGAAGQASLYFQISQNAKPQDPLRFLARR